MSAGVVAEMTLPEALRVSTEALRQAGITTPSREAAALLAGVLGCRPLEVYLARTLTAAQVTQWQSWLAARCAGTPLQHLTGQVEWWGDTWTVTPDVLIPRPETELVAEAALQWAIRHQPAHGLLVAVDLGTGSGALAVGLTKRLPSIKMVAVDRSMAALQVARLNATQQGVASQINFVQGIDMQGLATVFSPHLVVGNPPYIPTRELADLPPEVQREPRLALDGGVDGCQWLAAWLAEAAQHLAPGGAVVMELGAGQAEAATALVAATGRLRLMDIMADWHEIPRVLLAERL